MNWDAIAAVGEILGAVAVVFTLAYLAKQVRLANRIAMADAYRSARLRQGEMITSWAEDPEFAKVMLRVRFRGARRHELTADERAVVGLRYQGLVHNLASIYEDVQLGILPDSAYELAGREIFTVPYVQDVWPIIRQEHSPDFVRFFESRFGIAADSESITIVEPGANMDDPLR